MQSMQDLYQNIIKLEKITDVHDFKKRKQTKIQANKPDKLENGYLYLKRFSLNITLEMLHMVPLQRYEFHSHFP